MFLLWLTLVGGVHLRVEPSTDFAGEVVVIKQPLDRACFSISTGGGAGHVSVARYDTHTKLWNVPENTPVYNMPIAEICMAIVKPGLYRPVYVHTSVQDVVNVAQTTTTLSTGQVHHITTTTAITEQQQQQETPMPTSTPPQTQAQCACPCMTGVDCTTIDKCFGKYCGSHGGICQPDTGYCQCPTGYTGPNCQLPACSHHGFYHPIAERCMCRKGWAGPDCSVCGQPKHADLRYICMPSKHDTGIAYDAGYVLMEIPASMVDNYLTGLERADHRIPYPAILPNGIGFNGKWFGCDCIEIPDVASIAEAKRISNGDLDFYNATIVECIEASNATTQQTTDMVNLWTSCVSAEQAGLLTNGYWIGCIILGIIAIAELIIIIVWCVASSYTGPLSERKRRI